MLISKGDYNRNKKGFQNEHQKKAFKHPNKTNSKQWSGVGLYPGGLITGCSFWFTGGWAYNWGGGGAYKQQFTVYK